MKTALCIGINDYPGTDSDLAGCVNDAHDWAAALAAKGYTTQLLLDKAATRADIIAHMADVIQGAAKSDKVVITFSGHGTQIPDVNSDEPDGMDEALCGADVFTKGPVYDDEIWNLFRKKVPGVQCVLISDSCHSGTVARGIGAPQSVGTARRRYIPHQILPDSVKMRTAPKPANYRRLVETNPLAPKVPWPVLLLSGCQDNEYSYDAFINRRSNGAMTAVALDCLKRVPPGTTYSEWFNRIRQQLPSRDYPQTPRMIGSYLNQEAFV